MNKKVTGASRRSQSGSGIAELGPAMWIMFMFGIFPLLSLMQLASGAVTVWLVSVETATKVANATDFMSGVSQGQTLAGQLAASGVGKFAKMVPSDGVGVHFYIEQTNVGSNATTVYGPDSYVPPGSAGTTLVNPTGGYAPKPGAATSPTIDPTAYIYQIEARCTYSVGPFLDMSHVPFIGDVPMLGKPATLTMSCLRSPEDPMSLAAGHGG